MNSKTIWPIIFHLMICFLLFSCRLKPEKKIERYSNGTIKSIQSYEEGILADTSFYFYPSGRIKSFQIFSDGQKNGTSQIFYENGSLKRKSKYKNGTLVGAIKMYDESGKLISEYATLHPSVMDTLFIEFELIKYLRTDMLSFVIQSNIPVGNILLSTPNGTISKGNELGVFEVSSQQKNDSIQIPVQIIINDTLLVYYKTFHLPRK